MSSESRIRRSTRARVKKPVTNSSETNHFDDTANVTNEDGPTRMNLNGKRDVPLDDGLHDDIQQSAEFLVQGEDLLAKSTKLKGKSRTSKSNKAKERLYDIDFILTNPKSPLVDVDISDVINYDSWTSLSLESRSRLSKLLPGGFLGKEPLELDDSYPSRRSLIPSSGVKDGMMTGITPSPIHGESSSESKMKKPGALVLGEQSFDPSSFFKDPHFESAARTFQDHLYSGWFASSHCELVDRHLAGIRDGSLHASWKDDSWDLAHPDLNHGTTVVENGSRDLSSSRKGKESKSCEFHILVRKGFLKEGDIVTLKHKFTAIGITVEKDSLVHSIHPKTSILTLTTSSSTTRELPSALLMPHPNGPTDLTVLRDMTVSNAAQLVTALLDIDGRVPRVQRPRMDTWKVLSVWKWPSDSELQDISPEESMLLERGGRVPLGTLFYLRGQALDD